MKGKACGSREWTEDSCLVATEERGGVGVAAGGPHRGVAQDVLFDLGVVAHLEQMGGEAVPEGVKGHLLLDPRGLGGAVGCAA